MTRAQRRALALAAGLALCAARGAYAGPYSEPGHHPNIVATWASAVTDHDRGPIDVADPMSPDASHGTLADALSPPSGSGFAVYSLGDGGHATFHFPGGISDQPGDDFAVFENGFFAPGGFFGELAFVEVSSDGVDFVRFPATCLRSAPVEGGGVIDPTDYHNFAGKHPLNRGTGFDLAELGLSNVAYVRLVDVIGDGSTFDEEGRPVYDPYPTPYASGGFDADAVGAPEPGRIALLAAGSVAVFALSRRRGTCARRR